jgi:hypothetical protein
MIKDEEMFDEVIEAQRQGHRFFKIFLDRSRIGHQQAELLISGAVILRGFKKGSGIGGAPEFEFKAVHGQSLVFRYSKADADFVCMMYDDPGPGYFSATGYNRDLLATHYGENFFYVKDPEIKADIEKRVIWLEENKDKRNQRRKDPSIMSTTVNNVDDIDSQIAFLESKKKEMLAKDNNANLPPSDEAEKKRLERNAKQRAYRKKKADKAQAPAQEQAPQEQQVTHA